MFIPKFHFATKPVDIKRRNLVKLALFGGGAFVLGKVVGPSLHLFSKDVTTDKNGGKETLYENFRVNENGAELGIYDRLGNEILVIEKE